MVDDKTVQDSIYPALFEVCYLVIRRHINL